MRSEEGDASLEAVVSPIGAQGVLSSVMICFGAEVERGYAVSIYNYTNDLGVRDLLGEILSAISIARGAVRTPQH